MGFGNICDGEDDNVKNYEEAESTKNKRHCGIATVFPLRGSFGLGYLVMSADTREKKSILQKQLNAN